MGGSLFPGPGFGSTLPQSLGNCPQKGILCLGGVCLGAQLRLPGLPRTSPGGALFRWLGLMRGTCQKPELLGSPGHCLSKTMLQIFLPVLREGESLSAIVVSLLCLWWVSWFPVIHLQPFHWTVSWLSFWRVMMTQKWNTHVYFQTHWSGNSLHDKFHETLINRF